MLGFGGVAVGMAVLTTVGGAARATPAAEDTGTCAPAAFATSRPAAGDVDVPTDVSPVFVFDAPCGIGLWYGQLLDADGLLVMAFDVLPETFNNLALARVELGGLAPNTAYSLRLDGYDAIEVPFTTGDGPLGGDAPATPEVALTVDEVTWAGPVLSVASTVSVTGLPAVSSVVHLQSNGGDSVFLDVVEPWQVGLQSAVQPGSDLCASVFVEDAAGRASGLARGCAAVPVPDRPDPIDTVDEESHGCAVGPSPARYAGALAALAALAVRRRSRRAQRFMPHAA